MKACRTLVTATIAALAMLVGAAGPAGAWGGSAGIAVGGQRPFHDNTRVLRPGHGKVVTAPPKAVFIDKGWGPRHGRQPLYAAPYTYYVAPFYADDPRWVPGFWTYQWVPQDYVQDAWVPGYYDARGVWIDGHWEQRAVQTGFYQQVWVDGYWAR